MSYLMLLMMGQSSDDRSILHAQIGTDILQAINY